MGFSDIQISFNPSKISRLARTTEVSIPLALKNGNIGIRNGFDFGKTIGVRTTGFLFRENILRPERKSIIAEQLGRVLGSEEKMSRLVECAKADEKYRAPFLSVEDIARAIIGRMARSSESRFFEPSYGGDQQTAENLIRNFMQKNKEAWNSTVFGLKELFRLNLSGIYLCEGWDMEDMYLANVIFSGGHMIGADLRRTVLDHSDFRCASLNNALFNHANVFSAWFQEADLSGADFSGARVIGSSFRGAILKGTIGLPKQKV